MWGIRNADTTDEAAEFRRTREGSGNTEKRIKPDEQESNLWETALRAWGCL